LGFAPGYGATLAATIAATTLAAVLAALIAGRDALIAIPVSFGLWAIIGASVVAEGLQLGHAGLTGWGGSCSLPRLSQQPQACSLPPIADRPASRPPAIAGPSPQDDEWAGRARTKRRR